MKIEGTKVWGFENAIIGMRLPMSFNYEDAKKKMDSFFYGDGSIMTVGEKDLKIMKNLISADGGSFTDGKTKTGAPNSKFLRDLHVQVCVTAPMYWWAEMDTYKIGTVRNSNSKMHKLASTEITKDCFEMDDFTEFTLQLNKESPVEHYMSSCWNYILNCCEVLRQKYNETKDERYWKELIRLLPESWSQTAMLDLNYAVLRDIYCWRKNHRLTEWHTFCFWIETLPLAKELICNEVK